MRKGFLLSTLIIFFLLLLGLAAPAAAQVGDSDPCQENYKVARGDSLSKIARRCEVPLSLLIMANPQIKDPSRIFVGDEIEMPRRAEPAGEDSPTRVIRPEADQLTAKQIRELGIEAGSQERWIDVDLSSQTVSAYERDEVVATFLASTGVWRTPTVTGRFWIHSKFEADDMRGGDYFLRDVPYTMYFHKDYALHGTYWHDEFGWPMSHGCVNLHTDDAAWLFDFAEVGTMVNVHH